MTRPFSWMDLPYRIEEWSLDGRPKALLAAATNREVALAMARKAREKTPRAKIRLFGRPMTLALAPADLSELPCHVERWRPQFQGIDRVIAAAKNAEVARAGYRAAIDLLPTPILLRQGGRVHADSTAGDV